MYFSWESTAELRIDTKVRVQLLATSTTTASFAVKRNPSNNGNQELLSPNIEVKRMIPSIIL
jgi:hypothetical protein